MNRSYPDDRIPHWCAMPSAAHHDGMGGCWGISTGEVEARGVEHCATCDYACNAYRGPVMTPEEDPEEDPEENAEPVSQIRIIAAVLAPGG